MEASVEQLWHVGRQCVARLQVLQVLPKLSIILLFLCYIHVYIHVQIHVLHTGHDIATAAADAATPSRRLTWQLLLLHICVRDLRLHFCTFLSLSMKNIACKVLCSHTTCCKQPRAMGTAQHTIVHLKARIWLGDWVRQAPRQWHAHVGHLHKRTLSWQMADSFHNQSQGESFSSKLDCSEPTIISALKIPGTGSRSCKTEFQLLYGV